MPRIPKLPSDTIRLKRDIARGDSVVRGTTQAMAKSGLADSHPAMRSMLATATAAQKRVTAQEDSLKQYRKAAPTGTHKSFAQYTEGFDGAAITPESSPKPPRVSIPRGNPTPDAIPSAVGSPSGVVRADGTENLRADYQCFEAGDSRRPGAGVKAKPAGVQSFNDRSI